MSKRRIWSNSEIEFLKENIGYMKIPTIAKHLDRTEVSVTLKAKRLGVTNTKSIMGQITMSELARLLNIDPKSVKLWIENHGLPYCKKATRSTRKFYFIKPEEFWAWAFDHKHRIDFSQMEPHSIPPEPKWVAHERRQHENKTYKRYKPWTTQEMNMLMELYSEGINLFDIAKRLDRSTVSIQRKYQRLKNNEAKKVLF